MTARSKTDTTSTFIDNMSLPVHRWFRYSAGFSAEWAEETVASLRPGDGSNFRVLDPFAGSGTTLLSCDRLGVTSYGYESHPFIYKVADRKLLWPTDTDEFLRTANRILEAAQHDHSAPDEYPSIITKCYDEENLTEIDHLKKALNACTDTESPAYKLSRLAFVAMLRAASHAGTATWQYVLPNKQKARVTPAFDAFARQAAMMYEDMKVFQKSAVPCSAILEHDARTPSPLADGSIDLVITSPPYANNYDYADATRLELSVLGEIQSWGELQSKIRPGLIRSCSQMVSKEKKETFQYLENPLLAPIHDEILEVCRKLDAEKENHGGKKNYHTMIALYFLDLANVWRELRRVCREGSAVCFVIGDSAPYGVYVPVDEWLGRLAISAGFKDFSFEKTRDRNVKWKNRKHQVPLKEGRLWIKG